MNKQEFLKKLKYELRKLKKEERNKYIEYYDEIISDIMERGVSEEEAIVRQGSVEKIAGDILSNTNPSNLKIKDWRGIVLIVASLILSISCLVRFIFKLQLNMSMSTSVGVIGGADGPTSIFIAGKIGTPWGLYIVTAIVLIATIVYFVRKHKRNK